ncbi:hypothetical protein AJOOGB_AJOOGB_07455, partial [Dysosmobacter welbionis]
MSIGRSPLWRTPSLRPAIPSPGCGRRNGCKNSTPPPTGQEPAQPRPRARRPRPP